MITKKAYTKPSLKRVAWDVNKCIYNRLLLNILYVINQKYGLNL